MSFDLVFFGGTGDLTWRKLMPALFQAFRHGKLPEGGRILAVARDEMSDDRYRAWLKERFREVEGSKRPNDEEFERFAALVQYRRMDLSQPEHYQRLKDWLDERQASTVVLYLATSPHLFTQICAQLGAAGINDKRVRVVLEKPLGHDLASAQQINQVVRSVFSESQAFRIDHYLGKPAVQNLMALRFGNALFEPLWRRESIANIQITLAEGLGVGTRGAFYDGTGAMRDMIQNHALQLLTMIAMEPPPTNDADAIRDEKLKVLRSLKAFTPESVARDVVRGQYRLTAPAKLLSHCAPRCRTGAGPACLSTCVPVNGWPAAMRRSSSISARYRTRSFQAQTSRTGSSSSCNQKTDSSCNCSRPRAVRMAKCSRQCRSTSTSTRLSPPTGSALTSACCLMPSPGA